MAGLSAQRHRLSATALARAASRHIRARLREFDTHIDIGCLALSPDGKHLAAAADDTIQLWRIDEDEPIYTLDVGASRLIFSADSTLFAALRGTHAQIWRTSDGVLIATLTGHAGSVNALAFAPSNQLAATGSEDGAVRLWHLVHTPNRFIRKREAYCRSLYKGVQ